MNSSRWIRGLCALTLSLAATTACQHQPPAPGFAVAYEPPSPADTANSRFLKDRSLPESAAADLNAYLRLPHRVTITARSCAGDGSGYDPDTHRIELCYDELTEQRELFTRAAEPLTDDQLAALVRETLHHEAGHALADALDLPLASPRAEEDAADGFAQHMLLRTGPDGRAALLTAAHAYDLTAAEEPPDPTDEHAPPAARAHSHRCAAHTTTPCPPTPWPEALTPLLR
ncbi:DUF4344 domain-containing metallopeptidase [Streptomyces sp. NBC_00249]|uniref:DUF4344 domain-containing metallopeptidase n=1 Tax=Streptomyces sp. NBC_00249 TaxID=2975690 RepID=UPI0022569722|nr:DUF4344 domain-containing metallopeptidase [Streptomyces sp. NBC_00249]MCX5194750.1 DUF4344 domain-containing metallopeptidase [Streptomyces sp. NBC_00249]